MIARLQILGKGLQWFQENSTFELFCSYSDASINVDPAQLRFYDRDGNQLSEVRGFNHTTLSSSSRFVNVSLTKDRIQAEDFGGYVCRYNSSGSSSFIVHVGILKGIYQSHRKCRIFCWKLKRMTMKTIFKKNCTHCFSHWHKHVYLHVFVAHYLKIKTLTVSLQK